MKKKQYAKYVTVAELSKALAKLPKNMLVMRFVGMGHYKPFVRGESMHGIAKWKVWDVGIWEGGEREFSIVKDAYGVLKKRKPIIVLGLG